MGFWNATRSSYVSYDDRAGEIIAALELSDGSFSFPKGVDSKKVAEWQCLAESRLGHSL